MGIPPGPFVVGGDRATPCIALLLVLGGFLNFMLAPLTGPMLIDAGFSLVEVGVILGAVMPIAMPLGAISGGLLITRFGLRWMIGYLGIAGIIAFLPLIMAADAGFAATSTTTGAMATVAQAVASRLPGWQGGPRVVLAIVALFLPYAVIPQFHMLYTVSRMEWASRSQAATDFTSHGALYNIGRTTAVAVSPLIAAAAGWQGPAAVPTRYLSTRSWQPSPPRWQPRRSCASSSWL